MGLAPVEHNRRPVSPPGPRGLGGGDSAKTAANGRVSWESLGGIETSNGCPRLGISGAPSEVTIPKVQQIESRVLVVPFTDDGSAGIGDVLT